MYVQRFIPYLFEKHNKKFEEEEEEIVCWSEAAGPSQYQKMRFLC